MASRKEYEMLFQLDAKLGSSYTSTFSKAKSGPSELQKEIRSLQSVQADISAYTKQQAAVEKTQAKLDNLNKQYLFHCRAERRLHCQGQSREQ